MTWLLWKSIADWSATSQQLTMILWVLWVWFMVKIPKYYVHFRRYPQDLVLFILVKPFGYFHNFIKLYALLTLHKVSVSSYHPPRPRPRPTRSPHPLDCEKAS